MKNYFLAILILVSGNRAKSGIEEYLPLAAATAVACGSVVCIAYSKLMPVKKVLLRAGLHSIQGKRPTMEDAHCVVENSEHRFYGVYDGHGGYRVADEVAANLYNEFVSCNFDFEEAFQNTDDKLDSDISRSCGSTAVCALIEGNELTVAHAGDSRAVICSNDTAKALTTDHKPNLIAEQLRIKKNGGYVCFNGCWRACKPGEHSGLAVSRAFGDKCLKPCVISEPEVNTYPISEKDQFLILACDGVWDVLANQQAVNVVLKSLQQNSDDFKLAAQAIVNLAYEEGSTDNITAMVIDLRK